MGRAWVEAQTDLRSVKRAYAQKLKTIDRNDPDAFQTLRDAFEAAKARAKPVDTPKQPSMREVAAGVATASAPHVTEDIVLAQDFDLEGMTDRIDTEESGTVEDISFAPPAPSNPAPPEPVPAASNPWSREDPSDVDNEDAFFSDLTATFDTGIWKISDLEAVLGRDIAMDRDIRDRAENVLFDKLRAITVEDNRTIPWGVAKIMEQHFGWASDGVRFNRHFGWQYGSEMVAYDVARALQTHAFRPKSPPKQKIHAPKSRIIMGVTMYAGAIFVLNPEEFTTEIFIFATMLSAMCFGIVWCIVAIFWGMSASIRDVLRRVPFLDRCLSFIWLGMVYRFAAFSKLETAFQRRGPRSTILFSIAFLATMLVFIVWGLERLKEGPKERITDQTHHAKNTISIPKQSQAANAT